MVESVFGKDHSPVDNEIYYMIPELASMKFELIERLTGIVYEVTPEFAAENIHSLSQLKVSSHQFPVESFFLAVNSQLSTGIYFR
jgi:hypothetical protein